MEEEYQIIDKGKFVIKLKKKNMPQQYSDQFYQLLADIIINNERSRMNTT